MNERVDWFFDTSVLLTAHDGTRPGHAESLRLMRRANRGNCACAAHSLAEFYSVLSRLPGGRRQRPDFAGALVEDIASRMRIVALSAEEYAETIRTSARLRIAGGTIYDALLVACARKVNAERIYTWNQRHFKLVAPDLADRIVTP